MCKLVPLCWSILKLKIDEKLGLSIIKECFKVFLTAVKGCLFFQNVSLKEAGLQLLASVICFPWISDCFLGLFGFVTYNFIP